MCYRLCNGSLVVSDMVSEASGCMIPSGNHSDGINLRPDSPDQSRSARRHPDRGTSYTRPATRRGWGRMLTYGCSAVCDVWSHGVEMACCRKRVPNGGGTFLLSVTCNRVLGQLVNGLKITLQNIEFDTTEVCNVKIPSENNIVIRYKIFVCHESKIKYEFSQTHKAFQFGLWFLSKFSLFYIWTDKAGEQTSKLPDMKTSRPFPHMTA